LFDAGVSGGQTVQFVANSASAPYLFIENDLQDFAGQIAGFATTGGADDEIQVNNSQWTYQDFVANAEGSGGSLMFSDGSAETSVQLVGAYNPAGFHANTVGAQTNITYTAPT
jgi:hypothetical protein